METAQLLGLPLATPTRSEVGSRGARRLLVESPVEIGADAAAGPVTSQHSRWTSPPPPRYSQARMIPERPVTIPLPGGITLEGALALPPGAEAGVVICHPHPRYGGDMDSPVVLTAIDACMGQGLATLRFNFRGVGDSGGGWDEGRGERDDVRAALAHLRGLLGSPARVGLAGYSFGAAMSAAVAAGGEPLAGLALIARS